MALRPISVRGGLGILHKPPIASPESGRMLASAPLQGHPGNFCEEGLACCGVRRFALLRFDAGLPGCRRRAGRRRARRRGASAGQCRRRCTLPRLPALHARDRGKRRGQDLARPGAGRFGRAGRRGARRRGAASRRGRRGGALPRRSALHPARSLSTVVVSASPDQALADSGVPVDEARVAEEQLLGAADEEARFLAYQPFTREIASSVVVSTSLDTGAGRSPACRLPPCWRRCALSRQL